MGQPSQLVVELHGLADSYDFCGSVMPGVVELTGVIGQIANGVPVPLGRSIICNVLVPTCTAATRTENNPGKENLRPRKRAWSEAQPMAESRWVRLFLAARFDVPLDLWTEFEPTLMRVDQQGWDCQTQM